jgi:hypothetical protein
MRGCVEYNCLVPFHRIDLLVELASACNSTYKVLCKTMRKMHDAKSEMDRINIRFSEIKELYLLFLFPHLSHGYQTGGKKGKITSL